MNYQIIGDGSMAMMMMPEANFHYNNSHSDSNNSANNFGSVDTTLGHEFLSGLPMHYAATSGNDFLNVPNLRKVSSTNALRSSAANDAVVESIALEEWRHRPSVHFDVNSTYNVSNNSSSNNNNTDSSSGSSNSSLLLAPSLTPTQSTPSNSSLPIFGQGEAPAVEGAVLPVTGSSLPTSTLPSSATNSSPSEMGYVMTNQNYLLAQQQQQQQFYHPSPQHLPPRHHQQQQEELAVTSSPYSSNGAPSYVPLSDFQGVGSWVGSAADSAASIAAALPTSASPSAHVPAAPVVASTPIVGSHLHRSNSVIQLSSQHHTQHNYVYPARPSQRKSRSYQPHPQYQYQPHPHHQPFPQPHPHLQIMTSFDSSLMYPSPQVSEQGQFCHPAQHYPWGLNAAGLSNTSPVDSCFSSGSSTPSSAGSSMSPSLSYSPTELSGTVSRESSRATSPSNLYEAYLVERRLRRVGDGSEPVGPSSLIIRSRKSSTSSTSSSLSQRRMSTLRETTNATPKVITAATAAAVTGTTSVTTSAASPTASSPKSTTTAATTTTSPTHQCPTCGLCFAGPAVLVRHIESIHDKLLWNCVGCKSNLSRRDAVTRHINLSPMDSICRQVGTIGQLKMIHGTEIQYEISPYRAKPLDEVMSRMGKKAPSSNGASTASAASATFRRRESSASTGHGGSSQLGSISLQDQLDGEQSSTFEEALRMAATGSPAIKREDLQGQRRRRASFPSLAVRRRK
ncbi:hypothetical protein EMPS_01791 [Entomortierella parvispora]|uniref:C2H2-type domain-containing protein n=1 Tax=Entomortierella parvispora TaxID=205924 RepID=A0A9P3LTA4_9FUNG|nr:hypothetical protein EMPS_01791 [Entomortierella parvispora]